MASHLSIGLPGGYVLRDHSTNDLVRVEITKAPRPALFLAQCADGKWNIGREWPFVETYRLGVSENGVANWLRLYGYPTLDMIFDHLEEIV